ncbi:ABC transporter permease [Sphingobacterium sp. HJSM2_6]|uniref:ABC transporter permease n=1 Tax=Sphingobacterium sp. HJSM2_6 TaxID=3366264 RepID=UPI003BDB298E
MKRLKLILRQIWKNKLFTGLNILGLAIGISACWIVFSIVSYEYAFDKEHPDRERIYKLYSAYKEGAKVNTFDGNTYPMAQYLKENVSIAEFIAPVYDKSFDEVKIFRDGDSVVFNDPNLLSETTSDYFKLVPYTWIAGNINSIYKGKNEVVLTESRAKQYFPQLEAAQILGKNLKYGSEIYSVSGIVKDLEYPSSFTSKEFLQFSENKYEQDNWTSSNSNFKIFIKLKNPSDSHEFLKLAEKKLVDMTEANFSKYNLKAALKLAPLDEVHFDLNLQDAVDKKVLYGLMGIASFLLILACINYINLSTAQVPYRAKEIGIRKTLGEQARHSNLSFIVETFFICLFALLLSWPLVKIFEKSFNKYFPNEMHTFQDLGLMISFLIGLIILLTLLSSIYPLYLINRVQIVDVLKFRGISKISGGNLSIRKALIIFQFIIAQAFVVLTIIMGIQMRFMMIEDTGFNKNAIINLKLPYKSSQGGDKDPFILKNNLKKYQQISNVSLGHLIMNNDHWGNNIFHQSDTGEVMVNMPFKYIENDYFEVYQLNLLAGRALALADSSSGVVLNEIAIQNLGFKSPAEAVGQIVKISDKPIQIVGVVGNFHNKNFHSPMEPIALSASNKRGMLQQLNIRLSDDPKEWTQAISLIEKEWKEYYPYAPFSYTFYDDHIKSLYESDYKFTKIINLSTVITILISCLGLIGLVTISTAQRTKEIGVRKVLGSSISGIVSLLSKDYIKLIFISIVIATPISWWAINKWLADFVYKVEIQWWMFVVPALLTLIIAFITMSYQSIKAAKANPVESLRDE